MLVSPSVVFSAMESVAEVPNSTYTGGMREKSVVGNRQTVRHLTVVTRVGPTDSGGVLASLTRRLELVSADPGSGGRVASQGLEVKSE